MELTYHEAALALRIGCLNWEAPTFTAWGMARAIEGLRGVRRRPNEYDAAGLLDQMEVFADGRRKRSTQRLSEVLREWLPQATSIIKRDDTQVRLPTLPPHPNAVR